MLITPWLYGLHRRGRAAFENLCQRVPTTCPLCASPARGGCLCGQCKQEMAAARQRGMRCACCSLSGFDADACPDCLALAADAAPSYERVIAAFDYANPGDVLIQQYKQHRFEYSRLLADLLCGAVQETPLPPWWREASLVPIPATRVALRGRGFNPAAELAQRLSTRLDLRVRPDWLLRQPFAHHPPPQKRLSRPARLIMQQHAYTCPHDLRGQCAVLVDDVMTTGATLHSAALTLREAGAVHVWALTAARTPYAAR